MNLIQEIARSLDPFPNVMWRQTGSGVVVVDPADDAGFQVALSIYSRGFRRDYQVGMDGWNRHFREPEVALDYFLLGLSDACRIAVTLRGRFPTRWTLERRRSDVWEPESEVAGMPWAFWADERVVYKQNRLIPARAS